MILPYQEKFPKIASDAFIAETAAVIGDVTIGAESSVWYSAVVRGDVAPITIGAGSNIQDGCVLHCNTGCPMSIGDNVTIGHGAIVHGSYIGDHVLIGMGAVILTGARIGSHAVVAAGAVVREKQEIPPGTLVAGVPAKIKRDLTPEEIAARSAPSEYVDLAREYRASPYI